MLEMSFAPAAPIHMGCCRRFMGDARWVVGWGMAGRAEFAYLIAQMSFTGGLMTADMF